MLELIFVMISILGIYSLSANQKTIMLSADWMIGY